MPCLCHVPSKGKKIKLPDSPWTTQRFTLHHSTHKTSVQRCLLHVQEGREIKVLAEELAALETKFRSVNPMGGTRLLGDWTVRIDGGPGRWAPAPACCWQRSACLAHLSWPRQEHS